MAVTPAGQGIKMVVSEASVLQPDAASKAQGRAIPRGAKFLTMYASQKRYGGESHDAYEAPAIEVLGTVEFLTACGGGGGTDMLSATEALPSTK
jgi:hypothetical protein